VPRIPIVGSGAASPAAGEGEAGEAPVQPDAVLLDDHVWIRKGWELSAARAGKRLLTCGSIREFSVLERDLDRSTVIFIDSDLRDEMPGERFAWSLFDAGFTELYLATGFEAERFPVLPWLKGVQGKDPPDWARLEEPGEDPLEVFEREARA
jgi:hypothetical protein